MDMLAPLDGLGREVNESGHPLLGRAQGKCSCQGSPEESKKLRRSFRVRICKDYLHTFWGKSGLRSNAGCWGHRRETSCRSEANGRIVHRKSFANTYSTNIMDGAGHSWNPGLFVDVLWNGGPVGKLTATKSQNLRRTSWKVFLMH